MADVKSYGPMQQVDVDALIARAKGQGFDVTGNGPWTIDTHKQGVVLEASYDPSQQRATVRIAKRNFYVPVQKVWDLLSPLMGAPAVSGEPNALDVAILDLAARMNDLDSALASASQSPVVGLDWKPPSSGEGTEADVGYLERAQKAVKESLERASSLPSEEAAKVKKFAKAAGEAIDKAAEKLLFEGAAGTLTPETRKRISDVIEDNKGTIAAAGIAFTATQVAIACVAAWLLLKH